MKKKKLNNNNNNHNNKIQKNNVYLITDFILVIIANDIYDTPRQ